MDTVQTKSGTHPLFYAAAGSVILFSALGSAAILGWLPKSGADTGASQAPVAAVATATPAPQPVVTAPVATPKPVARTETHPAHRTERHEAVHPAVAATQAPPADSPRPEDQRVVLAQAQMVPPPPPAPVVVPICRECGVIESVNEVEKAGDGSGLGAVAGGVVGAIAGKQVGGGRGRNVMSVLGAVGGAFAGNAIEKNVKKSKSYDITIRFEDGTSRTLSQPTPPVWRTGDRVRFVNGAIQPNA